MLVHLFLWLNTAAACSTVMQSTSCARSHQGQRWLRGTMDLDGRRGCSRPSIGGIYVRGDCLQSRGQLYRLLRKKRPILEQGGGLSAASPQAVAPLRFPSCASTKSCSRHHTESSKDDHAFLTILPPPERRCLLCTGHNFSNGAHQTAHYARHHDHSRFLPIQTARNVRSAALLLGSTSPSSQ